MICSNKLLLMPSKDAYYFSHDYDPTGDPKMAAMLTRFKGLGYGTFWRIVEMMHVDKDHKLPLRNYLFIALSDQLGWNVSDLEHFIRECISCYDLFISDGEFFWSNRVYRNIADKESAREIAVSRGRQGGIKSGESRRNKKSEAQVEQNEAPLRSPSSKRSGG